MTVPFVLLPADQMAPGTFVEFDSTRSQQGPSIQPYRVLFIGQKTSSGSATAQTPYRVTSAGLARTLFGPGSQLHRMFKALFLNNAGVEAWAVPLADAGGAVKAQATVTVTGTATAAGVIYLYVGGQLVQVKVALGDTQNTIAAAVNTAINANADLCVTSVVATNVATLSAKNAGAAGNYIDLRTNFRQGEFLPAGVTVAVSAFGAGNADASVTDAWVAASNVQYNVIATPYSETANVTALAAETEARFGPLTQIDGVAIVPKDASHGSLLTFGASANARFLCAVGGDNMCGVPDEFAAAVAGQVTASASNDPARPFRGLPLLGILGSTTAEQFDLTERDQLLKAGISTWTQGADGVVRIDWLVTTYKTDTNGAADISFRDLTTPLTLSYLRYDLRTRWTLKYARHKLAGDGGKYGVGQPIVTPSSAKAEILGYARDWELLGLIEDYDQFKADLVAEVNVSDPGRLDVWMFPNLVNGLRITAVLVSFRI